MIRLVADENFNHRILRGARLRLPSLDVVIFQRTAFQGAADPILLEWAANQGRVVITHDINTMPGFAYERVAAGQSLPGVIIIPKLLPIGTAIEELVTVLECDEPGDLNDQVIYLPL